MSKWNPDEHLPECGVTRYPICICDRLRACEQRVRLEDDDYAYVAAQSGMNDLQNRSHMRLFMHGWNEALDAAEQALLQVEADMSNWSSDETRAATDVFPELTADQWIWAQRGVGRSLLIIRALQSELQTSELQGKP